MPRTFALIFLLTLILKAAHGCLCPPPFPPGTNPFEAAYQQASTVVRAEVLSSMATSECVPGNCPGGLGSFDGKRVFELRLIDTFKGSPPASVFTADTSLNPVQCGINLPVGVEYLLNMAGPRSDGSFFLWLCQFHVRWDQLSDEQIEFLEM